MEEGKGNGGTSSKVGVRGRAGSRSKKDAAACSRVRYGVVQRWLQPCQLAQPQDPRVLQTQAGGARTNTDRGVQATAVCREAPSKGLGPHTRPDPPASSRNPRPLPAASKRLAVSLRAPPASWTASLHQNQGRRTWAAAASSREGGAAGTLPGQARLGTTWRCSTHLLKPRPLLCSCFCSAQSWQVP